MSPGGEDLVLEGATDLYDWTALLSEIRQRWPQAVFHKLNATEMFVYPDQETFRRELESDAVPQGFIHVLMDSDCLTLVVDAEDTDCSRVGHEVLAAIKQFREK